MTEIDFFGHIFYAFMALGTWYLGKHDINGWWLRMFGNVGWIVLGVQLGLSSIWVWEIIFLILAYSAYREWREYEKQKTYVYPSREIEGTLRYTKFGVTYDYTDFNVQLEAERLDRKFVYGKN